MLCSLIRFEKGRLRLPNFLQPTYKRYAFVLGLDINGKVVRNLQDPSPQWLHTDRQRR